MFIYDKRLSINIFIQKDHSAKCWRKHSCPCKIENSPTKAEDPFRIYRCYLLNSNPVKEPLELRLRCVNAIAKRCYFLNKAQLSARVGCGHNQSRSFIVTGWDWWSRLSLLCLVIYVRENIFRKYLINLNILRETHLIFKNNSSIVDENYFQHKLMIKSKINHVPKLKSREDKNIWPGF